MAGPFIVLSGLGPRLNGYRWELPSPVRIGRHITSDLVLDDLSVEKAHAEIAWQGNRWFVRDLAKSDSHPTSLNGTRLSGQQAPLRVEDVLQIGRLALAVSELTEAAAPIAPSSASPEPVDHLRASGAFLKVEARAHHTWDHALQIVAFNEGQRPQPGQAMLTLLRANHHLSHIAHLDELLRSVLEDAMSALDAQRGAVLLANAEGQLELKEAARCRDSRPGEERKIRFSEERDASRYSQLLTDRCFRTGESVLLRDVSLDSEASNRLSVRSSHSIICALLRSPRKRIGVLQLDRGLRQAPFIEHDLHLADAIAASVAIGIECAQLLELQRDQFVQTVQSLARAVEIRDEYTGNHTQRVTDYSLMLAEELKLGAAERYEIEIGTPLHDIGKIGIDDAILRKPAKLSVAEFELMKTHTVKGADILRGITNMAPMIPIVRHHHEKWDGSGYPDGLKGEDIGLNPRIVAVADAFDAMTTRRPYRQALPCDVAFAELLSKAGSHFDPTCVNAFIRIREKVERRMSEG